MRKNSIKIWPGERSFTLMETIVALGILVTFILEVGRVQGNAVVFTEYGRNVTRAAWLAKAVMAKVEYMWETRQFKDLETDEPDGKFEEMPEFTYKLTIKEWKLPLLDMLGGGGDKGKSNDDNDGKSDKKSGDMMSGGIQQILGDEILKIANVEVFWAEGAKRNSTQITFLLTNQRKVDEVISTFKGVWEEAQRKLAQGAPQPGPSGTPGAGSGTGAGTGSGTGPGPGGTSGGTTPGPTPTTQATDDGLP